jgi:hypothetical protein
MMVAKGLTMFGLNNFLLLDKYDEEFYSIIPKQLSSGQIKYVYLPDTPYEVLIGRS